MEIVRGYKTELDLNNKQRTMCLQHAGCARYAYNWGLARKKEALEARKAASDPKSVKIPNAIDLHKELNLLKKTELSWMYQSSKCAPQEALRNLDDAFNRFMKNESQFPQFKKRRKGIGSFSLTGAIHVGDGWIQLPRLGKIRLFEHGYLHQNAHVLGATVSEKAGHWFVSLQVQEVVPDTEQSQGDSLGVDLGIKELATCSDGTVIHNPKALKNKLTQLKRLQRALSRKQKGSKNRQKAKRKLAKLHYRISCIRKDTLHKATTTITARTKPCEERPQAIILEDLNVSGMMKNHKLAQAVSDVGLCEFKRQIMYKAQQAGITVVLADRFYPSSQLCSGCHKRPEQNIDLSVRTYRCEHCGLVIDRDLNAAMNLKLYTASSAGR